MEIFKFSCSVILGIKQSSVVEGVQVKNSRFAVSFFLPCDK